MRKPRCCDTDDAKKKNKAISLLQSKDTYHTFPTFGEDFVKFAFEFCFVGEHGIYPMMVHGKRFKRKNLTQFNEKEVTHFVQATEEHLPDFAQNLKFVNVFSIVLDLDPSILEPYDVRFSTEDDPFKNYLPAHYFMPSKEYQKFVYGKYEFDDELAPLKDFKKVDSNHSLCLDITHSFLSSAPLRQVQGFSLFSALGRQV